MAIKASFRRLISDEVRADCSSSNFFVITNSACWRWRSSSFRSFSRVRDTLRNSLQRTRSLLKPGLAMSNSPFVRRSPSINQSDFLPFFSQAWAARSRVSVSFRSPRSVSSQPRKTSHWRSRASWATSITVFPSL